MAKTQRSHSRAEDQSTYTWALSKELKAALLILAADQDRTLSNYLTRALEKDTHNALEKLGVKLTPSLIEKTLNEHATRNRGGDKSA